MTFTNNEGLAIVREMIETIKANREYLSEIDGAAGDGDHGINMSKGFKLAERQIKDNTTMSEGFGIISDVLLKKIGGSMGPLYGNFFIGLKDASQDKETIDQHTLDAMINDATEKILPLTEAKVGDKTLLDVLIPARDAYHKAAEDGKNLAECATEMVGVAKDCLEKTKSMVAKFGRSSRLGERSIGIQDAGATSCCLLLEALGNTAAKIAHE